MVIELLQRPITITRDAWMQIGLTGVTVVVVLWIWVERWLSRMERSRELRVNQRLDHLKMEYDAELKVVKAHFDSCLSEANRAYRLAFSRSLLRVLPTATESEIRDAFRREVRSFVHEMHRVDVQQHVKDLVDAKALLLRELRDEQEGTG